jgi:hypothetical protein
MIVSDFIYVKIIRNNIKYYKDKGYIFKFGDVIKVKIEDLPLGSNKKIDAKCDYCGNIKSVHYFEYIRNISVYNKFACSIKCSLNKSKITNLEKYGVENPFESLFIRETVKQTNLKKYGVDNYSKTYEFKEKIKQTNFEKYGVFSTNALDTVKNKKKETYIKNYNTTHYFNSTEGKTHLKKIMSEKYGSDNIFKSQYFKDKKDKKIIHKYDKIVDKGLYNILSYDNSEFKIYHKNCNQIFNIYHYNLYDRLKSNTSLCTICYPISIFKSIREQELINWLKELNITFKESDRDTLDGKELDIYILSHNLAIEFNGLYWHSELYKDKNYHLDKSLKSQEQGIQLLHIWEDEWVYKKDIIKSIILNRLGLIKEKFYARQCEIRVIEDSKLVRQFLDENHIQGYSQSSIKLGLFYQNELVSLMTFGYRHTNAKKEFELIRFCNRINLNVIGAASKLFKYFCNNYQFNELISYSDFRLFDGKMYETLGFTKQHLSKPDYFWCKNLERKHRFNFNKQKLIKEGYDSSKTEVEIMHDRGYYRIFGCGQYRWIYKNI